MAPGSPSTLNKILKPWLCASTILPFPAVAPGVHRSCTFTHRMPAYNILDVEAVISVTCPPSSKEPPEAGGGSTMGVGVVVAPGTGVAVATGVLGEDPAAGMIRRWPT